MHMDPLGAVTFPRQEYEYEYECASGMREAGHAMQVRARGVRCAMRHSGCAGMRDMQVNLQRPSCFAAQARAVVEDHVGCGKEGEGAGQGEEFHSCGSDYISPSSRQDRI